MTREEAIEVLKFVEAHGSIVKEAKEKAIEALEQDIPMSVIKELGEDLRIAQKGITDKKVLIGFNMAVALCNKHIGKEQK